MTKSLFPAVAACALLLTTAAYGAGNGNGPADHSATWHGHGSNHQGNNEPGDTAADRHNFNDATAGSSGKNPAAGDRAGRK